MKITISSNQAVSAVLAPVSGLDNELQLQAVTVAVLLAIMSNKLAMTASLASASGLNNEQQPDCLS
jgi:hypothetical protein